MGGKKQKALMTNSPSEDRDEEAGFALEPRSTGQVSSALQPVKGLTHQPLNVPGKVLAREARNSSVLVQHHLRHIRQSTSNCEVCGRRHNNKALIFLQ